MDRTLQPPILELEQLSIQCPERTVMPNGVPLNVLNAGDSEVVRIDILFEGGRWHQSQPLQALFTNRMLREGTRRYTAAEVAERLDYYGAWLELTSAAEHACVTLYSLNKYLPQTLDVLESIVKEPLFPERELSVVLNNNVQQFQVNSSKVEFLAHRGLAKALYGEQHPCGRLVQEEDYQRISPSLLRTFYDRHYHSDGCTVYVAGRVTDDCLRRIEALFGSEPFGSGAGRVERCHFVPRPSAAKRCFTERAEVLQSAVRMGDLFPGHDHPDFLKARVMVTLFGGYFGSRLMSNIREEKGYTYGITAGIISYPEQNMLVIQTQTANELVEPLVAEVYREIDRLQTEPVPDKELAMVKNYMLGEMCRTYESAFSLTDAWIFARIFHQPDSYFADMLAAVKEITPGEIRDLAGRYLCKETLKESISGKKMS